MPERDGDTGQFVPSVTLDEVRRVFGQVRGPPVVTSADVAEATGLSRRSACRKLRTLADRGEVDHRTSAGRVLWWLATPVGDPPPGSGSVPARSAAPARERLLADDEGEDADDAADGPAGDGGDAQTGDG